MNNINLDKYLDIVNEEKIKRGLENYIPLYPMLRIENEKLYVSIMIVNIKDNVWNINESIKPEYWVLVNIESSKIVEFNKTDDKDFVYGDLIPKCNDDKQKEMSKYKVEKELQYKDYLMNDIKNEELPLQKKLSNILENEIEIDGEMVNINDYLLSNFEEDITRKVNDLIDILMRSKFESIVLYYENLFKQVINEYIDNKTINRDKIKLCVEIINNYYDGVIGIDNMFNI